MRVNSFALFGDKDKWAGGFATNLRQHFTLYPDWTLWLHVDELPDQGYCAILKRAEAQGLLRITVVPNNGLMHQNRWKTLMMLWRLLPLWQDTEYVFCRDIDSILTPRQLQCVRSFISSGNAVHGICDNASHNIPLMGGMCGFRTQSFQQAFGHQPFDSLLKHSFSREKWQTHGTDQDFLVAKVWPKLSGSSYIQALEGPNSRCHLKVATNADISDIPQMVRDKGDDFTNYIGAVGTVTDHNSFTNKQIADFYNEYGNQELCEKLTKIEQDLNYTIL